MAVFQRGAATTATVVGIRYEQLRLEQHFDERSVRGPVLELALRVDGDEPFVCGVEQMVHPIAHLRLGQQVNVRTRGSVAVVAPSAGNGMSADVPASLVDPPERGIDDPSLWMNIFDRAAALPALVTFTDASIVATAAKRRLAARVKVHGPDFADFTVDVHDVDLRPYASHLERCGLALPGWARPGKRVPFVVDWARAATTTPGVGVGPGEFTQMLNDPGPSTPRPGPVIDLRRTIDGVSFETWAEALAYCTIEQVALIDQPAYVERFGIAPESWPELTAHWSVEMQANPRLEIAMREIDKRVRRRQQRR